MGKVADTAARIAQPVIEGMGFELVETEYVCQHKDWYLNFYIDQPGGVSIEDCEAVSQAIDPLLDEADPTEGEAYILGVSSPGLDRPIKSEKDYRRVMGQKLEIKLYKPLNGKKQLVGELTDYADGQITLASDSGSITLQVSEIALCRLYIEF